MPGQGIDVIEASIPRGACGATLLSGLPCPFTATAGGLFCRLHGGIATQHQKDLAVERVRAMRAVLAEELMPEAASTLGRLMVHGRDERVQLAAALAIMKEAREESGKPEVPEPDKERALVSVDDKIAAIVVQAREKQVVTVVDRGPEGERQDAEAANAGERSGGDG